MQLTISEVVEVVRRLDAKAARDVSPRQLRYWDTALSLRAKRAAQGRNAARVFSVEDVAIVRLVRRLQRDDVPARAIWGLLVLLGDELRAACRPGISRVLWLESNGRPHVLTAREAANRPPRECYALADVVDGIAATVRAMRTADDYAVWNGAKAIGVRELVMV